MIKAQVEGLGTLEFPDGTDQTVIQRTVTKMIGQRGDGLSNQSQPPAPSVPPFSSRLLSVIRDSTIGPFLEAGKLLSPTQRPIPTEGLTADQRALAKERGLASPFQLSNEEAVSVGAPLMNLAVLGTAGLTRKLVPSAPAIPDAISRVFTRRVRPQSVPFRPAQPRLALPPATNPTITGPPRRFEAGPIMVTEQLEGEAVQLGRPAKRSERIPLPTKTSVSDAEVIKRNARRLITGERLTDFGEVGRRALVRQLQTQKEPLETTRSVFDPVPPATPRDTRTVLVEGVRELLDGPPFSRQVRVPPPPVPPEPPPVSPSGGRVPIQERELTPSQLTAGNLRSHLAELRMTQVRLETQLSQDRAVMARLPVDQQRAWVNAVQSDELNTLPTDQRRLAETYLREQTVLERDLKQAGLVTTFREHYWRGLWKRQGETSLTQRILGRRPLSGPEGFRKQKVFPTYQEGLDAGLTPLVENPVDQILLSNFEKRRALMGHAIFNEEKAAGRARFVKFGEQLPIGHAFLDDKLARVLQFSDAERGFVIRGRWALPEGSARVLNNYLAPGLRGQPLYDAIHRAGNTATQLALGLSGFHAKFSATTASISDFALGIQRLMGGQVSRGVRDISRSITLVGSPVRQFLRGRTFKQQLLQGVSDDPVMAEQVQRFIDAGGRAQWSSFQHSAIGQFVDAFRSGKRLTAAKTAIPAFFEATMKPIFEHLVPNLKLGAFLDLAEFELSKLPPGASQAIRREVLGRVQDSMDNRFGQLIYDNLHWNRTLKDIGQISALSLGWQIGSIREIGGGLLDLRKLVRGELTPRTAFTMGLPVIAALEGSILMYLMTGKGPETLKDYFYPRTGRIDSSDGREVRLSPASYIRDVVGFSTHPVATVEHKANPIYRPILEMLENENFYGQEIHEPTDPLLKQIVDTFAFIADQFIPFSFRNLRAQQRVGASGIEAVGGFVGLPRAPASAERTPEQQAARDLRRRLPALRKKQRADIERPRLLNEILGIVGVAP